MIAVCCSSQLSSNTGPFRRPYGFPVETINEKDMPTAMRLRSGRSGMNRTKKKNRSGKDGGHSVNPCSVWSPAPCRPVALFEFFPVDADQCKVALGIKGEFNSVVVRRRH